MTIHISSDAFYTFSPQRNSPLPTTFETLLLRKNCSRFKKSNIISLLKQFFKKLKHLYNLS